MMSHKYAIDFGTTNSIVARWDDSSEVAQILSLPELSDVSVGDHLPMIPSLVYIQDAVTDSVVCGQAVRDRGLDQQQDNRLFRNFKRGIVTRSVPDPREIDGKSYRDHEAGWHFMRSLIDALPHDSADIEQLVVTAPVMAFESYLDWLTGAVDDISPEKIRIVDESTAAALGYAVSKPGAVVLVFDFGGGTLDLSLVQLPEHREKTGGLLQRLRRGGATQHVARVIAKAGRVIGGSDIDQWLLAEVLQRAGITPETLGNAYASLLTRCEIAKIALSTEEQVTIAFDFQGRAYNIVLTRQELETLLETNGFYTALRRVVDKVMYAARQRGIFKEDIHYVLMVGGTSLMPSVQHLLGQYFSDMAVRADKTFTAVAEGALQVAAGFGLDDYLIHSYGLRHLNEATGEHEYDEIVAMGSRYPINKPIEVKLGAAHRNQSAVELVIGEIDTDTIAMIEVKYHDGQAIFVAGAGESEQRIVPLITEEHTLALLEPPGQPGEERLLAQFTVDEHRRLRASVIDTKTSKELLRDVVIAALR